MFRNTVNIVKHFAFTLAEILIILGVVGVISALTLPALMSKCNEILTINALKKTYAELSQAIKMSEVENGDLTGWEWYDDYSKTDIFVKKYILPYLSKSYTKCIWMNPCFKNDYRWKNVNGTYADAPHTLYSRYKYNGKTITFRLMTHPCTSNGYVTCSKNIKYLDIIVDVNGDRGDSIMGKDVFGFTLFNYTYKTKSGPSGDNYGLQLGSIAGFWGAYRQPFENLFKGNPGNCNKNGSGYDCGLALQKNGWKRPKQYPIKF